METKGFTLIESLFATLIWAAVGFATLNHLLSLEEQKREQKINDTILEVAKQLQEFFIFSPNAQQIVNTHFSSFNPKTKCTNTKSENIDLSQNYLIEHICHIIPKNHQQTLSFRLTEKPIHNLLTEFQLSAFKQNNQTSTVLTLLIPRA